MNKEFCPVCKTNNVILDEYKSGDETIISYLCIRCGYTSNSKYKINSQEVKNVFDNPQSSKLIIDLHFYDEDTSLYWFPTVLFNTVGGLFPEGILDNWCWTYVPIISMTENDKKEFGNQYDNRFAIELKETFNKFDFLSGCKKLGIVNEDLKID